MTRPAAVGAWALAGLAISLAGADPISRIVVLAAAWVLLIRRRAADRRLRPLAVGLVAVALVTVVVNGLLDHTGATVLVDVPSWVPLAGGVMTAEAYAAGASFALGLVSAISVAATLSLVLEPSELVDALPRSLQRTSAALGAALNLVPATAASFVSVRDAQRLRGWRMRGPRAVVDLAVPVLLGAIERSVQLAESMDARGFASGVRTASFGNERAASNAVVVAGSFGAVACLVAARVAGLAGSWFAYPTPSLPRVSPLVLVPAVVLAALTALVPEERQ